MNVKADAIKKFMWRMLAIGFFFSATSCYATKPKSTEISPRGFSQTSRTAIPDTSDAVPWLATIQDADDVVFVILLGENEDPDLGVCVFEEAGLLAVRSVWLSTLDTRFAVIYGRPRGQPPHVIPRKVIASDVAGDVYSRRDALVSGSSAIRELIPEVLREEMRHQPPEEAADNARSIQKAFELLGNARERRQAIVIITDTSLDDDGAAINGIRAMNRNRTRVSTCQFAVRGMDWEESGKYLKRIAAEKSGAYKLCLWP